LNTTAEMKTISVEDNEWNQNDFDIKKQRQFEV